MRFADELMHRVMKPAGWNPVIVEISNVIEYMWQGPQEQFDVERDFPNIAPPWPMVLFTFKFPRVLHYKGVEQSSFWLGGRECAVAVWSYDMTDHDDRRKIDEFIGRTGASFTEKQLEARWISLFSPYTSGDWLAHKFDLSIVIPIDSGGQYVPGPESRRFMYVAAEAVEDLSERKMHWSHIVFDPVWLALSFMHCRNTIVSDVDPPRKLAKRTMERHGVPMNTYKILEIEPVKKILASAGGSGMSVKQRLHICRGHFKDYRQRGLFGKERGLFWWGQHIRGTANAGVITKEYSVAAPSHL